MLLSASPIFLIFGLLVLYCMFKKNLLLGLAVLATIEISILNPLYKIVAFETGLASPRPADPFKNGMPSGHTSTFVAVFCILLCVNSKWTVPFLIWTLLVAWQRIASKRHTTEQVVAGAAQGMFDAFVVMCLMHSHLWKKN